MEPRDVTTLARAGPDTRRSGGLRWYQLLGIVLAVAVLTAGASYWLLSTYFFARDFKPVTLSETEEQRLDSKLAQFDSHSRGRNRQRRGTTATEVPPATLTPEPYSEQGASRQIVLSERELNALLANNTDLARKLAIDLSDDLLSAQLLLPFEPDFPILGGKTLRLSAGLELAYLDRRPVVILKGISIMGVPLPTAWMGGLKNIDLVQEFGGEPGFWSGFAAGIEEIRVSEGQLYLRLKP